MGRFQLLAADRQRNSRSSYTGRMPDPQASPEGPRGRGQFRASDADRELVAEILRRAAGDGRLTLGELDQRLEAAHVATTYAELEKLTEDLPGLAGVLAPPAGNLPAQRFGGNPTSRFGIALMSGFNRAGRWVVPRRFTGLAIMGFGSMDMRNASFAEQTVRVTVFTLMGGMEIVVPEDAEVQAHGLGIMGGFGGHRVTSTDQAGEPVIIVTGLAIMGGIIIRRRPPNKNKE
jgi:hypothetical protein